MLGIRIEAQEIHVVRLALLVARMPLLIFGQAPKKEVPTIPADRRVDVYAIYSIVLAYPA